MSISSQKDILIAFTFSSKLLHPEKLQKRGINLEVQIIKLEFLSNHPFKNKSYNISQYGIKDSGFTKASDFFYLTFPNCLPFCSHLSQLPWRTQMTKAEAEKCHVLKGLKWRSQSFYGFCTGFTDSSLVNVSQTTPWCIRHKRTAW